MEQSEKNRQWRTAQAASAIAAWVLLCLLISGAGPLLVKAFAQKVAVFDFDKREVFPDPLARHIESRLRAMSPGVEVVQYTGLSNEARSVRLLSKIETEGYDLVITRTSDALIIAQHTLFKTPTLYTNVNNPLLLGFKTLGPPGGNISGASYYIPIEKHLRVYRAILPGLRKPGFIFDRHNKSRKVEVPEVRDACARLGMTMEMEFVENKDQLRGAAKALISRGVDAIIAASSGTIYENIHTFLEQANQVGVPIFSFYKTGVSEGAVAALSSDFFRMADELLLPMAEKVLIDRVSPGSLPAAFLHKNKLFVNRAQVERFGLTLPPELNREHDVVYIDQPVKTDPLAAATPST
jgi:putative ABC transport system substrate-binding protein